MQDIDFLPVEYRQLHARRQVQPWRVVVVAVFVALLGGAIYSQYERRRQTKNEMALVLPQYEEAIRQKTHLAEAQGQLQTAETTAELFTYLRHPWPRTQLLAALLAPLPSEIAIQQLHVTRETPLNQAFAVPQPRADKKAEEEKAAKLPPAARDLKRLRDEFDKTQTLIRLSGITSDSAALHHYLGALGKSGLLAKVELRSIDRLEGAGVSMMRFQAVLIVKPGYGQPGGPTKAEGGQKAEGGTAVSPIEDTSPKRKRGPAALGFSPTLPSLAIRARVPQETSP